MPAAYPVTVLTVSGSEGTPVCMAHLFFFRDDSLIIRSDLMMMVLVRLIFATPCRWLIRFLATISPISIPG
jgi:hypothetical protein